jgi:hypothetical protein
MPALPGGECPKNGPFAYVYGDLFAEAKRLLRLLGDNPPPRWTPATDVLEWQRLISFNVQILLVASNIRPQFLFPTATDPGPNGTGHPDRNWAVSSNWREADKATKRTLMDLPRSGEPVFREGARERWAHQTSFTRGPTIWGGPSPQALLDARAAMPAQLEETNLGGARVTNTGDINLLLDRRSTGTTFERQVVLGHTRSLGNEATMERIGAVARIPEHALSQRIISLAWINPSQPFVSRYGGTSGLTGQYESSESRFYVTRWVEFWDQVALAFAELSLDQMLLDALGFYVFNHNIWYSSVLGLSFEQIRSMQVAMQQAALAGQPIVAAVRGVTTAVAGAISPAAGAVVNLMTQAGDLTFKWIMEALETDAPKTLFVRIPPLACRPVELLIEAPGSGGLVFLPDVRVDPAQQRVVDERTKSKGGGGSVVFAGAAILAAAYWFGK